MTRPERHLEGNLIELFRETTKEEPTTDDDTESVCDWDLESTGGVLSMRE
ncbi:hypothetical protein [Pseudobacteriovorax antillogorgiicola]|uniref:Uncharacterized protein n=1 Tax=Pseudobacteriovorax antillogorgiicola TaxID=1513793 RepID=A0A1Y6CVS7_9BACT|nr:hypothetical protein [Pseudobacteriovorax antillogorgiicola]TCS51621.1 hypothetical protein EDD56_1105 [Pseudobacteriovorax antillogorgiicola]SMF81486.1 hypothetical protein SAMN06296036_1375 [Pseudobacteriovorax antillogorgiicola]